MSKSVILLFIIVLLLLYFKDIIYIFILNNLIISRGILVPNCFWLKISDMLLSDGSGVNMFYDFKKRYGDIPKTYMFGEKTYIITEERHIKEILDNSPYPFGPGRLKTKFFKSFMKDNVGVSMGCPWKKRRHLNEGVLDTNRLHKYAEKFHSDTKNSILKNLNKQKLTFQDFNNLSKDVTSLIIFNTTNVHDDVFKLFQEANNVTLFYKKFSLNKDTFQNYTKFLINHIRKPVDMSLVNLCKDYENSEYEIIQQIPHFIFPIAGLYLTTIPRLLLLLSNHKDKFKKILNEIKALENPFASDIYKLPYLRNCVLEMLRLNNPVVTTFRTCLKDLNLDNYKFLKGDQLLILNNPVLRNPKIFKNPNKFIPERWTHKLEKSYFSISFNQGPQQCPAKELAIFLVQIFIVNFVTITGILEKGPEILKTKKINTDYINQMINTCDLTFTLWTP